MPLRSVDLTVKFPRKALAASAMVASMVGAALAAGVSAPAISERSVRSHMEFLASDALDGRGSGTRDEWIAATYLGSQMQAFGLEPLGDDGGYVQTIAISHTEIVGSPTLNAGSLRLVNGSQMILLEAAAAKVAGALRKYHPGDKAAHADAFLMPEGASPADEDAWSGAAMIFWQESPQLRAMWEALRSRPVTIGRVRLLGIAADQKARPPFPVQILLSADSYRAIAALPTGSPMSVVAETREVTSHTWNAVGRISGADPAQRGQVILLTAHLDHLGEKGTGPDRIYNGADDDASGTIAVLTLAQAIAAGPRPKRSIVFAMFGSEEVGSIGARYFISRPTVPLESITANLEFEMIGRSDAAVADHTLWLTGWERTNLGPELARHGARLVADPHPDQHFFMRSDNITLARRGVVAQTVSSYGLHAQYHQPSDDISHIDFQHMTDSINSMLGPIRWLADSGFTPSWMPGGRP